MNHHINNILTFKDKLYAIGEEIVDSHIIALLLCSLPNSCDPPITALEARSGSDLYLEFVKKELTDEFRHRCENKNATSNTRDTAYKVLSRAKKYCNYCKRENHVRSECYYLKNKSPNTLRKMSGIRTRHLIIRI